MLKRDKNSIISTPILTQKGYNRKGSKAGINFFNSNPNSIINLPVIVVGKNDYDCYKDSFEKLKDIGKYLQV